MSRRPSKRTAVHEAAHAVAAIVTRRPGLVRVTVDADEARGEAGHVFMRAMSAKAPASYAAREAVIAFASLAAETRAFGRYSRGVLMDAHVGVTWAERRRLDLGDLFERADRLVERHWRAIERLAGTLLEERTLTAAEARAIVRGA